MANLFVDLPVPVGNGVGAAVNTSAMGKERTITVQGAFTATLTVEISNDGVDFVGLTSFFGPAKRTIPIAAQFMRVRLAGLEPGTPLTANVDVACNDNGGLFLNLPAPAGNGTGASVNVSALGTFNSWIVTGTFTGQVSIEISEDGVTWNGCVDFTAPGVKSKDVVAQFMRVVRTGATLGLPGTAEVDVGAINDSTPGGGGGTGSGSNCLIFRPGSGLVGPVVFGTWAGLVAQLAVLRAANNASGCYVISFDDSIVTPAVVPAGAYDMTGVEWHADNNRTVFADVADGATFTGLRTFRNGLVVEGQSLVTPAVSDLANNDTIVVDRAFIDVVAGGAPFFSGSALVGGDFVSMIMIDGASIGTNPAGGRPVIDFPIAGTFLFIDAQIGGAQRNSVSGGAGAVLFIQVSTTGGILGPLPGFLGSIFQFVTAPGPQRDMRGTRAVPNVAAVAGAAANDAIYIDVSGGPIVQTLPLSVNASFKSEGRQVTIWETSGTPGLTVAPAGAETINGVAAAIAVPAGGSVTLSSDGAGDWSVLAAFDPAAAGIDIFNVFVFQPGGVAAGNVYTSFAAVTAAMALVGGVKWLLFDDTFAAVALPAGAFDMTNVIWGGVYTTTPGGVPVTVPEGTTLTNLRRFAGTVGGINVICTAAVTIPITDFVGNEVVTIEDRATVRRTGAVPFMEATGLGFDESVTLVINDGGTLGDPLAKSSVISMPAPEVASIIVDMRDESTVHDGAIATGPAVTTIFAINASSAAVGDAQAGITGPRFQFLAAKSRFNPNPAPPAAPAIAPVGAFVNDWLRFDVSGGAVAQTLPHAGQLAGNDATGQMVLVKETSGTAGLTVAPAGGNTIDGIAAAVAVPAGGAVLFISNGLLDWARVAEFGAGGAGGASVFSPPEKWGRDNIGSGTAATPMSARVSTLFDTIQMVRAGSIVGLNARLTAAITAGSCTVTVLVNGVPGTLAVTIPVAGLSARATQAAGVDAYVAGDLVGIQFSTGLGTTPSTADLEAWLEVV